MPRALNQESWCLVPGCTTYTQVKIEVGVDWFCAPDNLGNLHYLQAHGGNLGVGHATGQAVRGPRHKKIRASHRLSAC